MTDLKALLMEAQHRLGCGCGDSGLCRLCDGVYARITAALAEGDGWMPIETAPKGKQILVTGGTFCWDAGAFDASAKCEHVAMVHWHDLHQHWCGDYTGNGEDRYIYRPTHWQPLPPPPK